jgi:hypothetical protein
MWLNQRDFNNQRTKKKKKGESENLGGKDTTLNEGQLDQGINLLKVQEIILINVKRRWRGIKLIVN